ncbi:hypothetical protein REDROCK_57 [Mycobacterium phage RedRock]|uniref:RDF protein n=1 Tax=Mycobacterium phage RedRock TaxID=711470 RepID=D3JZB9_9CAUD|nr:hypothetical protein REDROCK_57 [Mycobacterium phage RedRock]ADB93750.1 hypothetical protein REDROCK_57 [Mycobacterium phage RedRock]
MSFTKLPYLHKNARSRQITTQEVREVFADEVTRGLDRRLDRDDYIKKVMP